MEGIRITAEAVLHLLGWHRGLSKVWPLQNANYSNSGRLIVFHTHQPLYMCSQQEDLPPDILTPLYNTPPPLFMGGKPIYRLAWLLHPVRSF